MVANRHLEACQVDQLLRLLDRTDGIPLPVCIEHRDKPDFLLSTRLHKIGLETSSFTDEEAMRADHLHFTRFPKAFITTDGLRDGAVRRSNDEIAETMLDFDRPWEDVADGARHIVRKISDSICRKRQKFRSPAFEKFDQNWLLLTDYPNPFTDSITDGMLAQHLLATAQSSGVANTDFDRIYVFYGPRCFKIQGGRLASKLHHTKA